MTVEEQTFVEFPKIPRLSRECVITEKIDGTNASIMWSDDMTQMYIGSRSRWLTVGNDNYGFLAWANANRDELAKLGPGRHFGEWWGSGIQRGHGLPKGEKRFSLFNTSRWTDESKPECCHVVPTLFKGVFATSAVDAAVNLLKVTGSKAAPGFLRPEGIVVFHIAGNLMFKKTIEKDEQPKGSIEHVRRTPKNTSARSVIIMFVFAK